MRRKVTGSLYFGGKRTIFFFFFAFYSVPRSHLLQDKLWNLCYSSWGLFYFISTMWEGKKAFRLEHYSCAQAAVIQWDCAHCWDYWIPFLLYIELEYFQDLLPRLASWNWYVILLSYCRKLITWGFQPGATSPFSKDLFYCISTTHSSFYSKRTGPPVSLGGHAWGCYPGALHMIGLHSSSEL